MANNVNIMRASAGDIYSMAWLLVVVEFSLLLLPFTTIAFPLERIQRGEGSTLNGRVVAVEHGDYLTAIIIRSGGIGRFPDDQMKLFVNPNTMVSICNISKHVENIRVGDSVTITYHKARGLAIADNVIKQC